MDWDDSIFDRDDFRCHLDSIGVLTDHTLEELISRTTPGQKSRTGNEFGFKPMHVAIGCISNDVFHEGFSAEIEPIGVDLQGTEQKSSFWIRFHEKVSVQLRS